MSDTIIMFENGKAVGGEGHPTNADEITFNNEDTGLVSEDVESAIKEVNAKFDKGSVSVTANGVKTVSALLLELATLVDFDKLNAKSVMKFENAILPITELTTNSFRFNSVYTGNNVVNTTAHGANTTSNTAFSYLSATGASSTTFTDRSSNVMTSGHTITIYY